MIGFFKDLIFLSYDLLCDKMIETHTSVCLMASNEIVLVENAVLKLYCLQ